MTQEGAELFKIVPSEYVPDDTIVLLSPLSYEETKKCATIEDVFKLLFKKRKISIIRNFRELKSLNLDKV